MNNNHYYNNWVNMEIINITTILFYSLQILSIKKGQTE